MILKGTATVVKNAGSHYMLSALPEWKPFPAVLKGKIRLEAGDATNPVAVGDHVRWTAEVPEDAITLQNPALSPRFWIAKTTLYADPQTFPDSPM